MRGLERGPYLEVAVGRAEAHDDVFRPADRVEPWLHESGQIEGRKGALANDDGMDEFDGDVLGVGGGFVMIPLLVLWAGLTQRQANATFT